MKDFDLLFGVRISLRSKNYIVGIREFPLGPWSKCTFRLRRKKEVLDYPSLSGLFDSGSGKKEDTESLEQLFKELVIVFAAEERRVGSRHRGSDAEKSVDIT